MGKVITTKSQIRSGDIILWRADRDKGGPLIKVQLLTLVLQLMMD